MKVVCDGRRKSATVDGRLRRWKEGCDGGRKSATAEGSLRLISIAFERIKGYPQASASFHKCL